MFQLSVKTMNVKYDNTLTQIYIAAMTEDIQRTGGKQLQGQRNILCLWFGLFQQL